MCGDANPWDEVLSKAEDYFKLLGNYPVRASEYPYASVRYDISLRTVTFGLLRVLVGENEIFHIKAIEWNSDVKRVGNPSHYQQN